MPRFAGAIEAANVMREFGCDRRAVTADECVAIEPALAAARPLLVGGDFTREDESGDAMLFWRLAEMAEQAGVVFRFGCDVERLVKGRQGDERDASDERQGHRGINRRCLCRGLRQLFATPVKASGDRLPVPTRPGLFGDDSFVGSQCGTDGGDDGRWPQDRFLASRARTSCRRHGQI